MSLGFGLGVEKFVSVPFNPASLFTDGAVGVLFDNNDLSTFYSDFTGSTQAVINGPVGLQLDKSQGLVLGPELAVNGDFSTDTWWTKSGATVTISDGTGNFTASPNTSFLRASSGILTVGSLYEVTWTITSISAGGLYLHDGSQNLPTKSSPGTYTERFTAIGVNFFIVSTGASTTASIDNVSIKKVLGNHRYQSSSTSRPTLRGTPTGGTLVTNGDFASGLTGWTNPDTAPATTTASGGTVTMNNGTTGTARLRQALTVSAGSYLITFTVTGFSGATNLSNLSIGNTTNGDITYGSVGISANGTYTRYVNNVTGPTLGLAFIISAGTATSFTLDNVSVVNVSSGSVTAPYGLQQDGTDDGMLTSSIDMSASDKLLVCMGAQCLASASSAIFVESSVNVGANAGTFYISMPESANNIGHRVRGSLAGGTGTVAGYTAPYRQVMTLIGDIAGDVNTLRANGVQIGTSAVDEGTGNLGNYPLYFGRRAGTSLPFNGLDFGGVIVNKTLTATQITACEKWVALRTGVSF